jgi:hypothetical protein
MFSFKIDSSGVERHFNELRKATKALEAPVNVEFNPSDPTDVERAISQIESTIDKRVSPFRGNEAVRGLADQIKARFREQIKQKVEDAARRN